MFLNGKLWRSPLAVGSVLFGMLAGAGLCTLATSEAASYLSNDPRACVNCHIMRDQYDGWQKASHHAHAVCNDCHTPAGFFGKYWTKMENGYHHSKGFTFQDFHEPILMRQVSADIVRDNCLRCHQNLVSDILDDHRHGAGDPDCLRCHSQVGHGPRK